MFRFSAAEVVESPAPVVATGAAAREDAPSMTEAQFREFYELTARPLKGYLARLTGNATLADDLLQEAYFRMIRANPVDLEEGQRKSYLYRIATNLARDHHRRARFEAPPPSERACGERTEETLEWRSDVERALEEVRPQEREMLWLAYVEGASHREIAEVTGCKEVSVRPMLFRARQKLAALLRQRGFGGE
jgi:RNA polymerase sigma-70 factor (ECF subfamily)